LAGDRDAFGDIAIAAAAPPIAPAAVGPPASGFFNAFISTASSSSRNTFFFSAPSQLGIWGRASSFFLLVSNSAY
jgi:hypothetical protein